MSYSSSGCGYGGCNNSGSPSSMYAPQNSAYSNKEAYENLEMASKMQSYFASQLERMADSYNTKSACMTASSNATNAGQSYRGMQGTYLKQADPAEIFLNSERPLTQQIETEDEIMPHIKEAFEKTTGKEFPSNAVKIAILSEESFREVHEAHNGIWSPGVQGFAVNTNGRGVQKIFAKRNSTDELMLTIGHEIGHIMTGTLKDIRDEEAKAFAFSMAWMHAIRQNNIAGIAQCINPNPARNGVHDTAFEFVIEQAEHGKDAMQIYEELAKGELTIASTIELNSY